MSIQESRARLAEAFQAYQKSRPDNREMAIMLFRESRAGYHAACADLVDRLPSLLAPFAAECNSWHPRTSSDETVVFVREPSDYVPPADHLVTIGDLRALGALFEDVKDAKV